MDSVGAARAAVLTRATREARAKIAVPADALPLAIVRGFRVELPTTVAAGNGPRTNPTRLRALQAACE